MSCAQVYLDVRGEEVTRRFEVLYVDERVRIVEFLSEKEPEPVIFIFKRVAETAEQVPALGQIPFHFRSLHQSYCL